MAVSIPFAWNVLSPYELASFQKSLAAASTFSSNFFFWRDGGYFEAASELKPLLHTWSLSVEEQYYLIFPFFLLLIWKLKKGWKAALIALIGLLSLIAAQLAL
ncbi:Acyltransferase 3 [Burkholderiaceae bacterium]